MLCSIHLYRWRQVKTASAEDRPKSGDKYIVQNNFGQFIAEVFRVKEEEVKEKGELKISGENETDDRGQLDHANWEEIIKIIRPATEKDLQKDAILEKEEQTIITQVKAKIKQFELPMKVVGANQSLDRKSLIVAFISENRVDFRELVRDLSRTFQKAVRLEQIGSRDEARIQSGFGPCGRELCCVKFNGPLKSINTDMARIQQITHRGSERLSGLCGRLVCCLAYELESYEEIMKDLPAVGDKVSAGGRQGTVRNLKVLQRKILVEFEINESASNSHRKDRDRRRDEKPKREMKWLDLKELEISNIKHKT